MQGLCYQRKKSNATLSHPSGRLIWQQATLLTFLTREVPSLHWCREGWRRKWDQPLPSSCSWRRAFSSDNGRLERNKESRDGSNLVERQHCSASLFATQHYFPKARPCIYYPLFIETSLITFSCPYQLRSWLLHNNSSSSTLGRAPQTLHCPKIGLVMQVGHLYAVVLAQKAECPYGQSPVDFTQRKEHSNATGQQRRRVRVKD